MRLVSALPPDDSSAPVPRHPGRPAEIGDTVVTLSDGVHVLVMTGEVDLFAVAKMTPTVNDALRSKTGDVVVDLTKVTFIDSTALAMLINALRRLDSSGRRLFVVCSEDGPVRRTLRVAGVDRMLTLASSRQVALRMARR